MLGPKRRPPVRSMSMPLPAKPTALPLLGVRLYFIKAFIADCGGLAGLKDLTTAQVCNLHIKSRTSDALSLCDALAKRNSLAVRPANWYIIHSWEDRFLDVIDAVLAFF